MKTKMTHWLFTLLAILALSSTLHAAETVTFFHHDALGSTIAATDENGDTLWTEEYTPYGNRIEQTGDGTNALWYTGKEEELGLNYSLARWYDPQVGRFLSIDPVNFHEGNLQSFNRYSYANNNPYKYLDPDGNAPILIPLVMFLLKEAGSEVVEQTTGVPMPTVKNGVKYAMKKTAKETRENIAKKVHGNSKSSTKEQHLYMIQDADGNIKKIGVSGQKLNKNGTSPRANSQLKDGDSATVLESGIPGRANVLQKEGQVVEGLRKAGNELPDQKRPKI